MKSYANIIRANPAVASVRLYRKQDAHGAVYMPEHARNTAGQIKTAYANLLHELDGEIAAADGVSIEMIRQRLRKALNELRRPRYSRRLAEIDERTPFYNHVGVKRFNSTWTSSTETAVIRRERLRHGLQCRCGGGIILYFSRQ